MTRLYALVDCNNFYASCERLFEPSLKKRPVIILSNNDGCVVARSEEAKKIGIPFAAPYFKVKALAARNNCAVFSSNYTLYADLSGREMTALSMFSPEMEVYSIDEAFLAYRGPAGEAAAWGREIAETVYKWTGIPVSVGIAPTRTLAKAGSKTAKRSPLCRGVGVLTDRQSIEDCLASLDTGDIWGIGPAYAGKLKSRGIYSALDFARADEKWVKKNMTIAGLRTQSELRGHPCIAMDDIPPPKKAIVSSRSFGRSVDSLEDLEQAVSLYTARAGEKLRSQGSIASVITVFAMTNRFADVPQYSASLSCNFPEATSHTPVLIRYGLALLRRIYKKGYFYNKAGVMLSGIDSSRNLQMNLFLNGRDRGNPALMEAVDRINSTRGRGTIFYASSGIEKSWDMKRGMLSPSYTTRWEDLPVIEI